MRRDLCFVRDAARSAGIVLACGWFAAAARADEAGVRVAVRQLLEAGWEGSFQSRSDVDELADGLPDAIRSDAQVRYALALVRASRPKSPTCPESIKKWIAFGGSVRAAQYLVLAGKARALTGGRYHLSFEDIRALAHPVLRHRVLTNFHAQSEGVTSDTLVDRLLDAVPMPRSGM